MQVLGAGGGLGGPAGPGGNFGGKTPNLGAAPHDWGFAKNDIIQNYPNTAQSPPTSRLWYLSNYHDALQAHMHPLHKLGNANTVANYLEYYRTLIINGTANGAASKAYLTASYVP